MPSFFFYFLFFLIFITINITTAAANATPQITKGTQLRDTPVGGFPLLSPIVSAKQGILITSDNAIILKKDNNFFIFFAFLFHIRSYGFVYFFTIHYSLHIFNSLLLYFYKANKKLPPINSEGVWYFKI